MYAIRPRPRAVLFDFFGTLTHAVRRGPAHAGIARALGVDPGDFAALLDVTFYPRASGALGPPGETLRRLLAMLGRPPDDAALSAALTARVAAVRTDTVLRADAVPVLAALRALGLRTAVVSDCWYELPEILPSLPVAALLDTCVYSVHMGQCKPHPAMYLTACARLGVEPDECLYVGDGGSRELTGAEHAGIPALRLAAPDLVGHLVFNADVDWPGPNVPSLTEVLDVLGRQPALVV